MALLSLQTSDLSTTSKPGGWAIKTVSSSDPFRKTLFTSSWNYFHPWDRARVRINRIVKGFITREKVSWKSKPWTWRNPLATNCSLNLLMEPSTFFFTLKTHLQPIACLLGGNGTMSQVLFFSKASYYCCIAIRQSKFAKACFTILGSEWVRNR